VIFVSHFYDFAQSFGPRWRGDIGQRRQRRRAVEEAGVLAGGGVKDAEAGTDGEALGGGGRGAHC
jgi:hypothetical protein